MIISKRLGVRLVNLKPPALDAVKQLVALKPKVTASSACTQRVFSKVVNGGYSALLFSPQYGPPTPHSALHNTSSYPVEREDVIAWAEVWDAEERARRPPTPPCELEEREDRWRTNRYLTEVETHEAILAEIEEMEMEEYRRRQYAYDLYRSGHYIPAHDNPVFMAYADKVQSDLEFEDDIKRAIAYEEEEWKKRVRRAKGKGKQPNTNAVAAPCQRK